MSDATEANAGTERHLPGEAGVWVFILDFMELRNAPLPLRLAFEAWALLVGGVVIARYWSAIQPAVA